MEGCAMRRLWHENMPHSSTFLNNCRVYAAGSMDETLPMFYDGSMQNIKEHTADFDVADFEPKRTSIHTRFVRRGALVAWRPGR